MVRGRHGHDEAIGEDPISKRDNNEETNNLISKHLSFPSIAVAIAASLGLVCSLAQVLYQASRLYLAFGFNEVLLSP